MTKPTPGEFWKVLDNALTDVEIDDLLQVNLCGLTQLDAKHYRFAAIGRLSKTLTDQLQSARDPNRFKEWVLEAQDMIACESGEYMSQDEIEFARRIWGVAVAVTLEGK